MGTSLSLTGLCLNASKLEASKLEWPSMHGTLVFEALPEKMRDSLLFLPTESWIVFRQTDLSFVLRLIEFIKTCTDSLSVAG